ncbi:MULTISPECIES: metalloprotease TldD [unclassified Motilimonas]|uniref:metalloprotease TldD n=1 Tax=unclassified Motilimonas TaxID=2643697 RepID=UPI001E2D6A0D|nr:MULTISPECIES: metalloprotease TldD [unclassified Motilimonas]MCE0555791.1 metalloprotease TldD [Motilimonas sp. E26]MDO6524160.1 metalloprotease TldD [Motilimonas sp. 1_MG-2023]
MSFETVCQHLLGPTELNSDKLEAVLASMYQHDLDYADLFFQSSRHESWVLEDGIVKEGSFNIEKGVGVRAVSGEKTGFAYSDQLSFAALQQAANAARGIAGAGQSGKVKILTPTHGKIIYPELDPLACLEKEAKINLLKSVDAYARSLDPAVTQVIVSMAAVYEEMLVAASDGTFASDVRPLIRFNCSVLAEKNGRRERGSAGGGGRYSMVYFTEQVEGQARAFGYAKEAVRQALVNLEAVDAPAGAMPVVLGSGWPGVLLHEAVGHGLEGDFNRKGASAFSGRIGEKVASEHCTIVDDATLANRRGSLSVDDEGTEGQYTVLIENGILKGYMQDKLNARLMGVAPTGNGRRESYAHLPMPRMTNTYMLPGKYEHDELIASVKKGIYAPNFGGGQVDITSGKFVFTASEAYLIENGKVTTPIKGATLIGNGPEAMSKVSMVGNNLALDPGVGVCGKDGQSVPVGVGQPSLKLDELTIGGTN